MICSILKAAKAGALAGADAQEFADHYAACEADMVYGEGAEFADATGTVIDLAEDAWPA